MKTALTIISLFAILINYGQTKDFRDGIYELKHEEVREINGEKFSDSYWMRLDGEQTKTILCRIPKKCREIELKSLTLKCIKDEISI